VLETLPRGELTRRAQDIAARHYEIPHSERTSVSVDTLLEWALRYRNGGFEALAPQARQDRGQSRTITPQLADLIERLKRENPHRTGTTLLRELALSSGKNEPAISASTLYRFLKQRGLSEKQLLAHRRTRSSRPHIATRSGNPTCSSAPTCSAQAEARSRPTCTRLWMMPAA
jgi:putative transposase